MFYECLFSDIYFRKIDLNHFIKKCMIFAFFLIGLVCFSMFFSIILGKFNCGSYFRLQTFSVFYTSAGPSVANKIKILIGNSEIDHYTDHKVDKQSKENATSGDSAYCSMPESDRFDCWPEGKSVSELACEDRGCCWEPYVGDGVPFCFYPDNFVTYLGNFSNFITVTENTTVNIYRNTHSPFAPDIMFLQVEMVPESNNIIHFKVNFCKMFIVVLYRNTGITLTVFILCIFVKQFCKIVSNKIYSTLW